MARKASTTALDLSDEELDTVIAGLALLAYRADGDAALAERAEAILARIEADLPDAGAAAARPRKGDGPHHAAIREAIRTETSLRLRYVDRKGAATGRTIWPLELGAYVADATLAAWCETRGDFRHFRLDRIEAVEPTGRRYPTRRRVLLAQLRVREMDAYF